MLAVVGGQSLSNSTSDAKKVNTGTQEAQLSQRNSASAAHVYQRAFKMLELYAMHVRLYVCRDE